MESIYLGRQPILNDASNIFAYEILYRDKFIKSNQGDDRFASSSVINSILNKFGTKILLGNRKAFIKIDRKFLMSDMILSIPKEFFVFCIFQSAEFDEKLVLRVKELYQDGYEFAINDVILNDDKMIKFTPIVQELSYIKINFHKDIVDNIDELINFIKKNNIKIIATKIETNEQFELAKSHKCDYFQGYFFAKPVILENKKDEPRHLEIFKLYNLLLQDTNIDEITSEFEKNPEITVQLLQFINSGAFHFRKEISSIHHILTLVGRIPLSQWLMLMIYSKSVTTTDTHSPLMLMVRNRTTLMQSILKKIQPNVQSNMLGEAYFVGLLSLIDVALSTRLKSILEQIHISREVKNALLRQRGVLGEIYLLVIAIENFDTEAIEAFEEKYHLSHLVLKELCLESMLDVESFERPQEEDA